jgi:hypothetical protein
MSGVRRKAFPDRPTEDGSFQGLPVPMHRVSTHAQGLRLRSGLGRLAIIDAHDVAFPLKGQGRPAGENMISELNGWPVCALVNASPVVLPRPAHDSGLEWFARPFPCDSFIRYSMPVLTGAFPVNHLPVIFRSLQPAPRGNLPIPIREIFDQFARHEIGQVLTTKATRSTKESSVLCVLRALGG